MFRKAKLRAVRDELQFFGYSAVGLSTQMALMPVVKCTAILWGGIPAFCSGAGLNQQALRAGGWNCPELPIRFGSRFSERRDVRRGGSQYQSGDSSGNGRYSPLTSELLYEPIQKARFHRSQWRFDCLVRCLVWCCTTSPDSHSESRLGCPLCLKSPLNQIEDRLHRYTRF
jgi:hypothetical protein